MAWVKGPGNLQRAALGPSPRRSPGVPCRVTRSRGARPPQVRGRGRGPTYCAGQPPGALLEQTHDLGLLRGRAAAADHRWALAGQLHELVFVVLEAYLAARGEGLGRPRSPRPQGSSRGPHAHLQGVSGDDQRAVVLPAEGVQLQVCLAAVGHLEGKAVKEALHSEPLGTTSSDLLEPREGQVPRLEPHPPLPPTPKPEQPLFAVAVGITGVCTPTVPSRCPQEGWDHVIKGRAKSQRPFNLCPAPC